MYKIVPDFIIEKLIQKEEFGIENFFILFLDIKGFTGLTETFMKDDFKGSEMLSDTINFYFGKTIDIIYQNKGEVINFAGDAVTAFVKKEDFKSVPVIVNSILNFFKKGDKNLQKLKNQLSIKIGVSFGEVKWEIVGDEKKVYYFKGFPIDNSSRMEKLCVANESYFDSDAKLFFNDRYFVYDKKNYRFNDYETNEKQIKDEKEKNVDEKILTYFKQYKLPESFMGEFRDVASLFISFDGIEENLHNIFLKDILSLSNKYKGFLNLIDFGDKGSKIFLIFGAPSNYENDLLRAALFFFDPLLDKYRNFIKGGLTYGKVYSGYMGSKKRATYTVIGDRVNVAARLMANAENGELSVDDFTERRLTTDFKIVFKEEKLLKGKNKSEKIYTLLEPNRSEQKEFYENEIIGRGEEIDYVEKIIKDKLLKGKNGGGVYFFGDAGVGKSRLVYEIVSKNRNICLPVIFKNDNLNNEEFSTIKQFLKNFFKLDQNLSLTEKIKIFKENLRIYDDESKEELYEPLKFLLNITEKNSYIYKLKKEDLEESIFFSLKELIKKITFKKSLIIVNEDIHLQDLKTNHFFEILSRNVENFPFIIIFTSRYGEDGSKIVLKTDKNFDLKIFELSNFDYECTKDYVDKQLIFNPSEETIKFIYEKSGGNPFFIEQYSFYLIENNLLEVQNDKNIIKVALNDIPSSISSIIISRIDRLTFETKNLLEKASVVGIQVEKNILRNLIDSKNFEESLAEVERQNIMLKLDQIKYIFKHALIRDTIYNMILNKKLKEYHKLVGRVMETLFVDDHERYKDIAYHYFKGEDFEKSKEFYFKAGKYSMENFMYSDALEFFNSCLNLSRESEDIFLIKSYLYRTKIFIGMWKEVEKDYEELIPQIDFIKNEKLKGEILKDYAQLLYYIGKVHDVENYLEKAYKIFERIDDKQNIIGVYATRVEIYWRKSDYDRALELIEKVSNLTKEYQMEDEYASNEMIRANILKDTGKIEESIDVYRSIIDICKKRKLAINLGGIYSNLGLIYWTKGDFDEALKFYEKSANILKNINSYKALSVLYVNMGAIYYSLGNYKKSEEYFLKQLHVAKEVNDKKSIRVILNNLGGIKDIEGDYAAEAEYFLESLNIAEEIDDKLGQRVVLSNLGQVYANLGDFEASDEYLKKSIEIAESINDKKGIGLNYHYLSLKNFYQGNFEEALKNIKDSIRILNDLKLTQPYNFALLFKGEILLKMGDIENGLNDIKAGMNFLKEKKEYIDHYLKYFVLESFYMDDKEEFVQKCLKIIEENKQKDLILSETYYYLYKKTKDEKYRIKAIEFYSKTYEKFKNYPNFLKLKELDEKS